MKLTSIVSYTFFKSHSIFRSAQTWDVFVRVQIIALLRIFEQFQTNKNTIFCSFGNYDFILRKTKFLDMGGVRVVSVNISNKFENRKGHVRGLGKHQPSGNFQNSVTGWCKNCTIYFEHEWIFVIRFFIDLSLKAKFFCIKKSTPRHFTNLNWIHKEARYSALWLFWDFQGESSSYTISGINVMIICCYAEGSVITISCNLI